MPNNNFQKAVDTKVVGLGNSLTPIQKLEYDNIDEVIANVEKVKKEQLYPYYIETLPIEFVQKLLVGKKFKNERYWTCEIIKVWRKKPMDLVLQVKSNKKNIPWEMYFKTVMRDCSFMNMETNICEKYFQRITVQNVDEYLTNLTNKKNEYNKKFENLTRNANLVINREVSKHSNEMVVSREAIRKAIRSIQKDSKEIANAFNSTLTQAEQETLIEWLAKNIYSMRLYVVKGSSWDKAISELYPEDLYGKHRQTIPSELSKDSINGYVSVNSIDGNVPYEILKKITHKQKAEDVIKQNTGSRKYRINNYLLVLYLLNNYNRCGFKLGKTNLNKDITLW